MKKAKIIIPLVIVLCVAFLVYWHCWAPRSLKITTPTGNVVTLTVERALSKSQQTKGLMNRTHLDADRGMIFLFKPSRVAYMWMKNTKIPLDMLFFDHRGIVLRIHSAKPEDLTIISSGYPVAGVLEINAGVANQLGIVPGSHLDLGNIQ